jgi:hypothetical protein
VQAGLDRLAVVVAHIRHGIERAAEDCLGLQRHRTAPSPVARIVGHGGGDDALGLTVHRRLHVVANIGAASLPALQRPALRSRAGELGRTTRLERCLQSFLEERARLERLPLRLYIFRDCTAGCPHLLWVSLTVQCLAIARNALVDRLEERRELVRRAGALLGIDRFALAAVNGAKGPRQEGELLAQQRHLPADLP